ncbi:MAG: C45 family autoproteolytic acyltransferase/hydrolase [Nocardioidaceae bacterium]
MNSVLTLPHVEISGGDRERGRQYGEFAAGRIAVARDFYEASFGDSLGLTWDQVRELAGQWLAPSTAFAPDLIDEMHGIADGAGLDLLDVLALNARGEVTRMKRKALPETAEDEHDLDSDGCSSFALLPEATGDGHVYCGQNWDWRHAVRDTVLLLRIVRPGKPTILQHVEAGQVGRQGTNSAGLALNANGLGGRFPGTSIGVPQPLIRRRVLDSFGPDEALKVLLEARQDIPSNALITHRDGFAIDLETTPFAHDWLYPKAGVLVHGNHYQGRIPAQLADTYRPYSASSLYRVPIIEKGLAGCAAATDGDTIRKVVHDTMSDHFGTPESVCSHPDPTHAERRQWSTLLSSCVDLTDGTYHLTPGMPCEHPYEIAPWNVYDGPDSPTHTR